MAVCHDHRHAGSARSLGGNPESPVKTTDRPLSEPANRDRPVDACPAHRKLKPSRNDPFPRRQPDIRGFPKRNRRRYRCGAVEDDPVPQTQIRRGELFAAGFAHHSAGPSSGCRRSPRPSGTAADPAGSVTRPGGRLCATVSACTQNSNQLSTHGSRRSRSSTSSNECGPATTPCGGPTRLR